MNNLLELTDRNKDLDGTRDVDIVFDKQLSYEQFAKILGIALAALVPSRDTRPFLRMRLGPNSLSIIELRNSNGVFPLRQRLAAIIANNFADMTQRLIRRDEWSAALPPVDSFLRVTHLRQDYAESGPQADYVPRFMEAISVLVEACEVDSKIWPEDPGVLSRDLAERLKGKPDQFDTQRWRSTLPRN